MSISLFIVIFLCSFILSVILTPFLRLIAIKANITDKPTLDRKKQPEPVALLGGVSIYIPLMIIIVLGIILLKFSPTAMFINSLFPSILNEIPRLNKVLPQLIAILIGATIIFITGLIDDIKKEIELPYQIKLFSQIVASSIVIFSGIHLDFLNHPFLNILITFLWIVGITNSFNFLDNMDGLAGGIAIISSIIFFYITWAQLQFFTALFLVTLIGSVLGFLVYNLPPAKIFMGDAGSLFIGFILATLTVVSSYVVKDSPTLLPVLIPIIVLSVPIFDTLSVIYIRLKEKRSIFKGDRRHLSHRLVELGMNEKEAVIFIYFLCFCIGLSATFLPYITFFTSIIIFLQIVMLFGIIAILMEVAKRKIK